MVDPGVFHMETADILFILTLELRPYFILKQKVCLLNNLNFAREREREIEVYEEYVS